MRSEHDAHNALHDAAIERARWAAALAASPKRVLRTPRSGFIAFLRSFFTWR